MPADKLSQSDVARLLSDPTPVNRAETAAKVAGAFNPRRLTDSERALAEEIFRLMVKDAAKVTPGTLMADWDPFAQPIVSEVAGEAKLVDVIDGVSVREETDEATGISSRVIIDWRSASKSADIKPAIQIVDKSGKPVKLPNGSDAVYLLAVGAILSVGEGDKIEAGDTLARVTTGGAKTKDITGGLPRVAELFEARRPKDHAIIADMDGKVLYGRDYKNKRRVSIVPVEEDKEQIDYLVPKGKHLAVQDGDFIKRGEYLMDGNPAPQDILSTLGVEALANYLIDEVQKVYRLQGVPINDKHIEVIVRQMLQKVEVTDPGDTGLITGEHIDIVDFEAANELVRKSRKKDQQEAKGMPLLLGITKASLQTRSFISAASFQETTRVLTEASVQGKVDELQGLKENVIVGRLIPAGTGGATQRVRRVAQDRDTVVIDAKREEAEAAAALAAPEPAAASGDDVVGGDEFDTLIVDTPESRE